MVKSEYLKKLLDESYNSLHWAIEEDTCEYDIVTGNKQSNKTIDFIDFWLKIVKIDKSHIWNSSKGKLKELIVDSIFKSSRISQETRIYLHEVFKEEISNDKLLYERSLLNCLKTHNGFSFNELGSSHVVKNVEHDLFISLIEAGIQKNLLINLDKDKLTTKNYQYRIKLIELGIISASSFNLNRLVDLIMDNAKSKNRQQDNNALTDYMLHNITGIVEAFSNFNTFKQWLNNIPKTTKFEVINFLEAFLKESTDYTLIWQKNLISEWLKNDDFRETLLRSTYTTSIVFEIIPECLIDLLNHLTKKDLAFIKSNIYQDGSHMNLNYSLDEVKYTNSIVHNLVALGLKNKKDQNLLLDIYEPITNLIESVLSDGDSKTLISEIKISIAYNIIKSETKQGYNLETQQRFDDYLSGLNNDKDFLRFFDNNFENINKTIFKLTSIAPYLKVELNKDKICVEMRKLIEKHVLKANSIGSESKSTSSIQLERNIFDIIRICEMTNIFEPIKEINWFKVLYNKPNKGNNHFTSNYPLGLTMLNEFSNRVDFLKSVLCKEHLLGIDQNDEVNGKKIISLIVTNNTLAKKELITQIVCEDKKLYEHIMLNNKKTIRHLKSLSNDIINKNLIKAELENKLTNSEKHHTKPLKTNKI